VNLLLTEIRHNPMLWLLAFVPVVFGAAALNPEAHTVLIAAIVTNGGDRRAVADGVVYMMIAMTLYLLPPRVHEVAVGTSAGNSQTRDIQREWTVPPRLLSNHTAPRS
jgi:hypothetical protein